MYTIALFCVAATAAAFPAPPELLARQSTCPKDLPPMPGFEFPHLIVPISKAHPDVINANTYFPSITPNDLATVFNFDILHEDQVCELGFYFPRQDQLETSSFTFNGPYAGPATFTFQVNQLGTGAQNGATTWNNQPVVAIYEGFPKTVFLEPGSYYPLWTGACPSGLFSMTVASPDTSFCWFQDYNPRPIGPFITYNGPISI